jgi:fused signal recognition particle receptor
MFRRKSSNSGPDSGTSPPPEEKQGFFKRLRSKLNRGNSWLTYDLADLFRGRKIDAQILEELESRLLTADVGVEATEHILSGLQKRVARNELQDVEALISALRAAIVEILTPCAKPLVIDERHSPFVILVVGVNGSGKTTTMVSSHDGWPMTVKASCWRPVIPSELRR